MSISNASHFQKTERGSRMSEGSVTAGIQRQSGLIAEMSASVAPTS
jgi:hypothetical protein